MKKIIAMAATFVLAVSCGQVTAPKVLVLYYSQNGNTKAVAGEIQNRLGADIEEIVPVEAYEGDFMATVERGRKELEEGPLPEIKPIASDLAAYDIIFIGYPVWFGTYAPPVITLLNEIDLASKKVVPFCTFGSGGLDSSIKNLKEAEPEAEVLPGYGVRAARIDAVPAEVDRFLKEAGLIEGEYAVLADFPGQHPVSEEESAIFVEAVGDYPMLHATASTVASREVPGGIEYLFTAVDNDREIKVYVLAEEGKAPVFTKVVR